MSDNAKCCMCDTNSETLVFNFKNSVTSDNRFVKIDISYSYCKKCDYIFIDHDKRIDLEKFYKDDYDFLLDNDEVEPEIDGIKYSEYLVSFFSEYLEDNKNKKILDIGAGKGNLLESFYKRFENLNYFAVEPSNAFFKLNKKSFITEKFHGFFNENIFKNIMFDYITLVEVLEHVPDPKSFLLSICDKMHEDSLLLVEVPNFANHKSDLLTIDHLSLFTENNLEYLFKLCGLEVVKKNIGSRVPMQFIVKLNKSKKKCDDNKEKISLILYQKAIQYIEKTINDAISIQDESVVIYGHNIILDYLIGNEYLNFSNIEYIINDNKLYQGKEKWQSKIDIISFEEYQNNSNSPNILLAMNDCYHERVIPKLKNKKVYGVVDDYK